MFTIRQSIEKYVE